jgi:hypothetical protein
MLDTKTEAGARTEAQDLPVGEYGESISRIGSDPDGFARTYSVALRVRSDRWQVW